MCYRMGRSCTWHKDVVGCVNCGAKIAWSDKESRAFTQKFDENTDADADAGAYSDADAGVVKVSASCCVLCLYMCNCCLMTAARNVAPTRYGDINKMGPSVPPAFQLATFPCAIPQLAVSHCG